MRQKLVLAAALALLVVPVAAQTTVPLVGCAGVVQGESVRPPRKVQDIPQPPDAAASRLAYYASRDLGVLAPRGWNCFEVGGTGGTTLLVTPEAIDPERRFNPTGPAIQLAHLYGATSGRFEIAKIANRLFPVAQSFVRDVIDEGIEPKEAFPSTPYPNVSMTSVSDTEVEFTATVADAGIGLRAKPGLPVSGVLTLLPEDDMDLVRIEIRLPPELGELVPAIVSAVRESNGVATEADDVEP